MQKGIIGNLDLQLKRHWKKNQKNLGTRKIDIPLEINSQMPLQYLKILRYVRILI